MPGAGEKGDGAANRRRAGSLSAREPTSLREGILEGYITKMLARRNYGVSWHMLLSWSVKMSGKARFDEHEREHLVGMGINHIFIADLG
jgi:hypothetical protein